MPIYEYKCEKGHVFEVMQRMADDPVVSCETCSAPVERVFHPIAVHFKGSGFYNTDYGTRNRSREMKEHSEKEKSAAKSDGSSGSASKDSKSSTATASKSDSKGSDGKSSSSSSSSSD
jgi:putative FmdB family regulatory protein